jgi:valyl-tRNA synthetase
VADLEAAGLLEKIEEHGHSVGHCYRCHTLVEPRLSPQWFVKMKPLAEPALQAVRDGRVSFVPERWSKVYEEWMENIRDWCISRQIWWGHRIPVFYCDACGHEWVARSEQIVCPKCGADSVRQDEDVLDTWFSSWLWPFSVFGWPQPSRDLDFYYPSNTLVTASEIIFFWVARMVMSGLEFMGDIPFEKVYIHGTVRDDHGRKMSKSLGNSIDPIEIIEKYSADALRFSLIMITATGQDVFLSDDKFEIGRNFGTKIWNAARFMQMQSGDFAPATGSLQVDPALLSSEDRNILDKLAATITACDENLRLFRFNDMAKAIYDFVWHHFCDWYLEYSKEVLYGDDHRRREQVLSLLHFVFAAALKLLHPLMPFITEELWHGMGYTRDCESIMRAAWPQAADIGDRVELGISPEVIEFVEAKHDMIRVARILMADYNLTPKQKPAFIVRPASGASAELLLEEMASVRKLLGVDDIEVAPDFEPQGAMPSSLSRIGSVFMPLEGLVDVAAEVERIEKKLEENRKFLDGVEKKLGNANFVERAPAEVVEQQRRRRELLLEEADKLRSLRANLAE